MRRRAADRDGLARELAGLPDLPLDALKQRWQELYGTAPPSRLGRALMIRAIAHRLQENALGGLKPAVARQCARATADLAAGRAVAAPASSVKPGTPLAEGMAGHHPRGRYP